MAATTDVLLAQLKTLGRDKTRERIRSINQRNYEHYQASMMAWGGTTAIQTVPVTVPVEPTVTITTLPAYNWGVEIGTSVPINLPSITSTIQHWPQQMIAPATPGPMLDSYKQMVEVLTKQVAELMAKLPPEPPPAPVITASTKTPMPLSALRRQKQRIGMVCPFED